MKTMQMMVLALVITLIAAIGWTEPDKKTAPLQLAVELFDGSRLIGISAATSIPIVTAIGKIAVPLAQVTTMTFNDDYEDISIALVNGDRLTGVQDLGEVRLKCLFGDVTIKAALIHKIECMQEGISSQAPVNGLIAWYPLHGDAKDASGNGLDGVLTKNVLPATDRFGTPKAALRFTGDNSYVRVADFMHNHNAFAACVWAKPDRPGPLEQCQDMISKHSNTVDMELLVRRELDGKYGIGWNIGGVFIEFDSTNVGVIEPTYTNWDFLVLQYTGSSIQLYVNGKLVRERNVSGAIVINQQDLTFGGYGANPNVESFIGLMNDVRFYNRALSPTEITQLYKLRKKQSRSNT